MNAPHRFAYSSRKYRRLVDWIARNDNDGDDEQVEELKGYLTVTLVADCYDLKAERVAADVWAMRHPHGERRQQVAS